MNKLVALLCAASLASCVTPPLPDDPPSSPASPRARESKPATMRPALRSDETSRAIAARLSGTQFQQTLAAPSPAASPGAYYTCVMHPEIRQDHPGKCPKCGMELIKKEGALPK